MESSKPLIASFPLEEFTHRAARAWWADGLWDLAIAGFCAITALWIYPLVRTLDFPSWTWAWPFITQEHVNPLLKEITLWAAGLFLIWTAYYVLARLLIDLLKRRFIAPLLGDVRYKFFEPMDRKEVILFWLFYVLGSLLLIGLFLIIKGGPHIFSAVGMVSFAVILFLHGRIYHLDRYLWAAIIGAILCVLAEISTTTAVYMEGPKNFMDVSPIFGNPTLVFLIWAAMLCVTGIVALWRTLRLPHAKA